MNKTICGECGGGNISTKLEEHRFTYGHNADAVELRVELPFRTCGDCNFRFTDDESDSLIHETVCRHLGVLTPAEIFRIRQHYKLSRKEFADISSIGEASLGRWESGALIQNLSNDNLLFLLSIPANIDRLKKRTRNQALNLISARPSQEGHHGFRCLSKADIERNRLVAAGFHL